MSQTASAARAAQPYFANAANGSRPHSTSRLAVTSDRTLVLLDDNGAIFVRKASNVEHDRLLGRRSAAAGGDDAGSADGPSPRSRRSSHSGGLSADDDDAASAQWQHVPTASLLQAHAIASSPGGRLLAAYGHNRVYVIEADARALRADSAPRIRAVGESAFARRPGLSIVHVEWHPHSDGHLCFLTNDWMLWMFDVTRSVEAEEQRVRVRPSAAAASGRPMGFAWGAARGWDVFSVYVCSEDGEIYVVCPVAPHGMLIKTELMRTLQRGAESSLRTASTEDDDDEGEREEGAAGGRHAALLGKAADDSMVDDGDEVDMSSGEEDAYEGGSQLQRSTQRAPPPPNAESSFVSDVSSLTAHARRRLSYGHRGGGGGGGGGVDDSVLGGEPSFLSPHFGASASAPPPLRATKPWMVRQAELQLRWLDECGLDRDDSERTLILRPTVMASRQPLVQGPLFATGSTSTSSSDAFRSSNDVSVRCAGLQLLERHVPLLLRLWRPRRVELLLALEGVQAQWTLAAESYRAERDDGGGAAAPDDDDNARAAEEAAPALLSFESIVLPAASPPPTQRGAKEEDEKQPRPARAAGAGCTLAQCAVPFAARYTSAAAAAQSEVFFVRGDAGIFCVRMAWLSVLRYGDAAAVAQAPPSVLSLLATTAAADAPPLGGVAIASPGAIDTCPLALSCTGALLRPALVRSIRSWMSGVASLPAASAPLPASARESTAALAAETEQRLLALVGSIPEPPPRLAGGELGGAASLPAVFELLSTRVHIIHDAHLPAFVKLHALLVRRAAVARDGARSQEQLAVDLRRRLREEVEPMSASLSDKLRRCERQRQNLEQRAHAVMQILQLQRRGGLSRAELRLRNEYSRRIRNLDGSRERVKQLELAADHLRAEKADGAGRGGEADTPTLRRTDRERIRAALEQHSSLLEDALQNDAQLKAEMWQQSLRSS